jgi:MFS family permease
MSQASLLKHRRFYPLFWTQFLGSLNDNFLKNAFVILVTFRATTLLGIPSAQMAAVASGIFVLPYFLFSSTAGQLADKYDKSAIIRIVKAVEVGIMLLAGVGFLTHQYEFLLAVLFLMGLHSTVFGPVKYSILPQHLSKEELVTGNAWVEAGTFLAILLGTTLGSLLISLDGVGTLVVSVGLLAVALTGYGMSRLIPAAPPAAPELEVHWNPIPTTLEILHFMRQDRGLLRSILAISWFWFFGVAVLALVPAYCRDFLHTDANGVSIFLATFSIGIGTGSLLCGVLARGHLKLGLVPFGAAGLTVFALDLSLQSAPRSALMTPHFIGSMSGAHILLDLFLLAVSGGLFIVPLYTFLQERSAPSHRSRMIAANNIVNAFFMVLSSISLVALMKLQLTLPQIFLTLALLSAVFTGSLGAWVWKSEHRLCLINPWGLARAYFRQIQGGRRKG